ncbi:MAG: Ig-like domain-containing protein [Synergistaceae bacterium]|nr:Ig-like domain-containing protein [Synergistaceae bacterium]
MKIKVKGARPGAKFAAAGIVFLLLAAAGISDAAVFRVTSGSDAGAGSLRQAVTSANSNTDGERNLIEIDPSVEEIHVSSTINITGNLSVSGRGTTVRGSRITRLFSVDSGGTARFEGLTLTDGYPLSESGGAVYIDSTAGGKADFVNCTFFRNRAGGSGGAVYVYGGGAGATTFTNCTLTANEAADNGGGVAVSGGIVEFNASIVTGNASAGSSTADVYSDGNGIVSNVGQYNVIGQTSAALSFPSSRGNVVSVSSADVFKTPGVLSPVDGANVAELLSATSNAALDLIPADTALALSLPGIDERGAPRPQMTAVDAGAYELSPVALSGVEIDGGSYVQRSTSEKYSVRLRPGDVTLDVRNYEGGIEWTVVNPSSGEVIAVDRFGNVTGLSVGEATLRATAHGWTAAGAATKNVRVGEDPLPIPTISVTFVNPRTTMGQNDKQTLKLSLTVNPADTPRTVVFESDDPLIATVTRSDSDAESAVVTAHSVGQATIRVRATAKNSKGEGFDEDEFTLAVNERSGSGGGGCDGGFGIAGLALAALFMLRSGRNRI